MPGDSCSHSLPALSATASFSRFFPYIAKPTEPRPTASLPREIFHRPDVPAACGSPSAHSSRHASSLPRHVLFVFDSDDLFSCDLRARDDFQRRHLSDGVELLVRACLPHLELQPGQFHGLCTLRFHDALVRHCACARVRRGCVQEEVQPPLWPSERQAQLVITKPHLVQVLKDFQAKVRQGRGPDSDAVRQRVPCSIVAFE